MPGPVRVKGASRHMSRGKSCLGDEARSQPTGGLRCTQSILGALAFNHFVSRRPSYYNLFPGSGARGQRKTERYQNSESQYPKSLTLTDLKATDIGSQI